MGPKFLVDARSLTLGSIITVSDKIIKNWKNNKQTRYLD